MANNEKNVVKSIDMIMEIERITDFLKIKPSDECFSTLEHIINWINDDKRKHRYIDYKFFLENMKDLQENKKTDT